MSTPPSPADPRSSTSSALYWLAGVVFVVSVAALVALELAGRPTAALLGLVGPVVSGLVVTAYVGQRVGTVQDKVEKVQQQTNGDLDRRLRQHGEDSTVAALIRTGLVTPDTVTPKRVHAPDQERMPAGG
jgi:hypothetical protein